MQPQIVNKPAFTVVGLLINTKPRSPEIPELWPQFGSRMGEIQHVAEPGVSYGLMRNFDHEAGKFDYMAGMAVENVVQVPAGMVRWDVPANIYAVFETTLPDIFQTFDHIYQTWLPTSGYQQAAGPEFERYGESFNPEDPASRFSIYIPVVEQEP